VTRPAKVAPTKSNKTETLYESVEEVTTDANIDAVAKKLTKMF